MRKKSRFASKGETILTGRPASLEDFLGDKPSHSAESEQKYGYTENLETKLSEKHDSVKSNKVPNQNLERRFELKIPDNLAKQINEYAFERRISKAAVVIEALQKYFQV